METKNNELKELILFSSIALPAILIFSFVLFGITGMRVVLGIVFVSLPFYFILNNFELSQAEKFVFSILLGLTIFPSLAYIFGLLISFRIAILLAFIIFLAVAFVLTKYKHQKN